MSDIEKCVSILNEKGFKAAFVPDAEAAVVKVLELIDKSETVGAGGSMTLEDTGIIDALLERGNEIYSSAVAKKKGTDKEAAKKLGMTADWYLSSTNAVTLQGDLINIDAIGNRVAGMFYGPENVLIVAGRNKITQNPHTAVARIKKTASPLNTKRLGLATPCAQTGVCADCSSPDRICNVTVRITNPPWGRQIYVILIDEDFGF